MSSLSNVNKDLMILLELEQAIKFMRKEGIPYPVHPRIFMSGDIAFQEQGIFQQLQMKGDGAFYGGDVKFI